MDVLDAIHTRRSIRAYRRESPARDLIEELLWAAVQAPSPPISGEVPWSLSVIEGVEKLASYGERVREYARVHEPNSKWPQTPGFKVFWDAPILVLICAKSGNTETPFDCCRAGQNLMLAAHARGLGTCWVGAPIPWLRSAGIAEELGLPQGFDPVVAMVLGYPAEAPAGKPRPRPRVHWCNDFDAPESGQI